MNQQVVYQDISQIHPYENNPRNNEAAIEPVAQSIKRFGFRVPILIDGKGTIIAGHTRYEAAKRLGMDKVPCIRVDDLTDEQIRAYRIADNKVAEASSWNDDILRTEMDALKALDVDLTDTGFSEVELDGLLREVEDADFVIYTSAIEHMHPNDGAKSLEECYKVMKPGAKMFLSCPNTPGNGYQTQYRAHVYEWGYDELKAKLAEIGFSIVQEVGLVTSVREMDEFYSKQPPALKDFYERMKSYVPSAFLTAFMAIPFPREAKELLFIVQKPKGEENA